MKPSDEKVRAMVHAAVRALEDSPSVRVADRQAALGALRRAVADVLAVHDEIDAAVRAKIRSLARRVTPGSREYSDLYARYLAEEQRRKGL